MLGNINTYTLGTLTEAKESYAEFVSTAKRRLVVNGMRVLSGAAVIEVAINTNTPENKLTTAVAAGYGAYLVFRGAFEVASTAVDYSDERIDLNAAERFLPASNDVA